MSIVSAQDPSWVGWGRAGAVTKGLEMEPSNFWPEIHLPNPAKQLPGFYPALWGPKHVNICYLWQVLLITCICNMLQQTSIVYCYYYYNYHYYINIYCWSNQGFLDYPGSISPVVSAMNPLATCVHNREHPPVRSGPVVRVPLLISMPQQPQQSSEERPGPWNSSAPMDQALEELASSTVWITRISLFNPPFALVK